jgi:hypothetical protein
MPARWDATDFVSRTGSGQCPLGGGEDLLFAERGSDRDRELATPLHAVRPHESLGYRAPAPGGLRPSAHRMAVCAPWFRSDGHAPAGVATQAKLTFEPDHSPDPLHPLVVDQPACVTQQSGNHSGHTVEQARRNVGRQPILIIAALRHPALRRAMLAERRTRATLGDVKLNANMLDAGRREGLKVPKKLMNIALARRKPPVAACLPHFG